MGGGAEIAFGWRVISGRLIDIKVHSTPDYTRSNSGIEQENNLYFENHQPSLVLGPSVTNRFPLCRCLWTPESGLQSLDPHYFLKAMTNELSYRWCWRYLRWANTMIHTV